MLGKLMKHEFRATARLMAAAEHLSFCRVRDHRDDALRAGFCAQSAADAARRLDNRNAFFHIDGILRADLRAVSHALTPPNGSVRVQREIYGVRMFINRMANDTPSEYEPHTRMRTVRRPQPKPKITRPQFVEGVVE